MDPLFPEVPEDLSALSDEDLATLLQEHEAAAELIDRNDEDFIKGMSGEEIIAAYDLGVEQIEKIVAEQKSRAAAIETFNSEMEARKQKRLEVVGKSEAAEEDEGDGEEGDGDEGDGGEEEEVAVVAEAEEITAEAVAEAEAEPEVEEKQEEKVLVTASVEKPKLRRPPAPSPERQAQAEKKAFLTAAAGLQEVRAGQPLDRESYAKVVNKEAQRWGAPSHSDNGREERMLLARTEWEFPPERTLSSKDAYGNQEKIRAVIPAGTGWGEFEPGRTSLTASGGLCAPLTPFYDMPNFGVRSRPVRDALPSFRADRGGVNVPAATYIGDITTAISSISEANDALGGTFATKSCQDLSCPAYTEVAVQILAHCREYGNLNAMAWPEKIAHENDITMQALDRTAEGFLLDRIKTLSINVTNGAETLGALIYLVDAIVKASFGIRGRLRMSPSARFRALIPSWVPSMLALDTVQTQFDRFTSEDQLVAYLRGLGIDPTFYIDTPSTGTTQLPDAAQTAAAIDPLPDNVQWAIFPEGAFLHIDGGSLELGIVRDSTLNATNDFQLFGEQFENVALLGPAQSAYWVTSDLCASGQFPPAGTVRTCD